MMSHCFIVLRATVCVVLLVLMLAPSPALLAPVSTSKRQVQQSPSNTSVDAFNGITVTLLYTETRPEFAESGSSEEGSAVADSLCDLLAYHDILASPSVEQNSSFADNVTENLLLLLELNVADTCAWMRVMEEASGLQSGAAGLSPLPSPTSCELDNLRLFCLTRRLALIELSLSRAVENSTYDVYNGGSTMAIPIRLCEWIDRKVPELKPHLDGLFFC